MHQEMCLKSIGNTALTISQLCLEITERKYCIRRWSNLNVSVLNLQAPLSIVPSVTCQEAIDIMKKEGFDQLPVVANDGYNFLKNWCFVS